MGYLPTWAYGASLLITSLKSQISPEKHKVGLVARPPWLWFWITYITTLNQTMRTHNVTSARRQNASLHLCSSSFKYLLEAFHFGFHLTALEQKAQVQGTLQPCTQAPQELGYESHDITKKDLEILSWALPPPVCLPTVITYCVFSLCFCNQKLDSGNGLRMRLG